MNDRRAELDIPSVFSLVSSVITRFIHLAVLKTEGEQMSLQSSEGSPALSRHHLWSGQLLQGQEISDVSRELDAQWNSRTQRRVVSWEESRTEAACRLAP